MQDSRIAYFKAEYLTGLANPSLAAWRRELFISCCCCRTNKLTHLSRLRAEFSAARSLLGGQLTFASITSHSQTSFSLKVSTRLRATMFHIMPTGSYYYVFTKITAPTSSMIAAARTAYAGSSSLRRIHFEPLFPTFLIQLLSSNHQLYISCIFSCIIILIPLLLLQITFFSVSTRRSMSPIFRLHILSSKE